MLASNIYKQIIIEMKKIIITVIICMLFNKTFSNVNPAFEVKVVGKGPAIILIPGYSCSGEVWYETVEYLKNKYECHVLTLAGYAGVPAIDTPILKTVRDQLISYVKTKKLIKPILIGHSLGAFMSLWMSSQEPNLFGEIICVDGIPFISSLMNPNANADSLKISPNYDINSVIKNFINLPDSGFIERTAQSMVYQVSDTNRAKQIAMWQYKSDRRTLGITLVEISTTDIRKNIAKIKSPILMLGSIYGSKENSAKLLREQFINANQITIHIADSKHFIMYDQPQWLISEIDNFLN